ncbi:uroporphyrinogen-III synthase [Reinekea sp. G2M2-21]|uniref:uroporphyrinogen-III synthase n=1 Tax=Reinekea sp. G2M2-21 TaxID=2788942 RepID=UPI0018AB47AA|nr:uroporphyrinogen-III synthase [Reinekea sp. G2M2-21]
MLNILVPKAKNEQARWLSLVDASCAQLSFVDPWQMTVMPETPEQKSIWLNIDQYKGVISVSPSAARVLTDALDRYWPMPPVGIHWLCNGPRTASVLESAGLKAGYPQSGYTAEDVLRMPETQVAFDDKWLIVKGEGGRVTLRDTLAVRGALATEVVVYQREVDRAAIARMVQAAEHCDVLWLSSEFLGEQLLTDHAEFWRSWPGQIWVSSPRMQRWAYAQRLNRISTAPGATPEALATMINQTRT